MTSSLCASGQLVVSTGLSSHVERRARSPLGYRIALDDRVRENTQSHDRGE